MLYTKFFKRLFDIVLALIAAPFVALAVVIMAPFIYFEDKGPIFYNGVRRGRNGKSFKMFKLRSMYVDSPDLKAADGSTFNSDKDPRVTKIGRFMRKTSIDELPQIFNILIGDMSFIGPRPTLAKTPYEQLPENRKRRLQVLPGVTGYTQAYYRNSITQDEKFKYDLYYVENISFWMDVKILFKTAMSVLRRENIYVSQGTAPAESAKETVDTK